MLNEQTLKPHKSPLMVDDNDNTTHTHKHSIDLKKPLIKQGDHVIKDYDVQSIHFSILTFAIAYNTNLPEETCATVMYNVPKCTVFGGLAILSLDILLPITLFHKMCLLLRSAFKICRVVVSVKRIGPLRTIFFFIFKINIFIYAANFSLLILGKSVLIYVLTFI